MAHGSRYSRVMRLAAKATSVFRTNDLALDQIDLGGLKYAATVSVRAHWFVVAVLLFELVYRPYYGVAKYAAYGLLLGTLVGLNGYVHYLLRAMADQESPDSLWNCFSR